MHRRHLLQATALLSLDPFALGRAADLDQPFPEFDDHVTRAMKDWQIPGLAIAVVKDDRVVLCKGYGVRKRGGLDRVDERTLFALGSCTKPFTAAMLATLVEEDKLRWDDPVVKHLPGFQLADPYVTRAVTVRDLLAHRTGASGGGMLDELPISRNEMVRRLRYLKADGFRAAFNYQNLMYVAAGQVAPAVTGKTWDENVRQRLFLPLGMTSSFTNTTALRDADNVAAPHARLDGQIQPVPYRSIDNLAPAGAIISNAVDLVPWLRLQLGDGAFQKKSLYRAAIAREMQAPQMVVPHEDLWSILCPDAHFVAYGLGWFLYDHRGRKVVQHPGQIDGMHALIALAPEEKLGVAILTNRSGHLLPQALWHRILDAYLSAPVRDWSGELLKIVQGLETQGDQTEEREQKERVRDAKPSLPSAEYAGSYQDELYGTVTVAVEDGGLVLHLGALLGALEHWHYDTFRVTWRERPLLSKPRATFQLDAKGQLTILRMRLDGAETVFRRVSGAKDAPKK